jgi:hypothetical protein
MGFSGSYRAAGSQPEVHASSWFVWARSTSRPTQSPVRRDFELFVRANIGGVRPRNTSPRRPTPRVSWFPFRVQERVWDWAVCSHRRAQVKVQVEVVERPARTHFRAEIRLGCAVGVRSEQNCGRGVPEGWIGIRPIQRAKNGVRVVHISSSFCTGRYIPPTCYSLSI